MINFANAQYLLLLLLIPFFFVVQALVLMLRRRRIRKFGDETLVSQMMPSYSKAKVWVRLSFFSLGFFLFYNFHTAGCIHFRFHASVRLQSMFYRKNTICNGIFNFKVLQAA